MCLAHTTYYGCGHIEDETYTPCPQAMTEMNHAYNVTQSVREYDCAACFVSAVEEKVKAIKEAKEAEEAEQRMREMS